MTQKKIVAVDMDDTLVFLMKAIMEDHNKKHPEVAVTYEQMKAFHYDMLHPDYDCFAFMKEPEVFYNLRLMDDHVLEEMKAIHEEYDLIIVTSAFPEHVVDKWRWLQEYLPFIPHRNFCAFSRKDLIQADILIDDAAHNVEDWVKTSRPTLVPEHPWNLDLGELEGVTMFKTWQGMKQKLDSILMRS